jgi:hypothetical protein
VLGSQKRAFDSLKLSSISTCLRSLWYLLFIPGDFLRYAQKITRNKKQSGKAAENATAFCQLQTAIQRPTQRGACS